jgi:hypothetical protein
LEGKRRPPASFVQSRRRKTLRICRYFCYYSGSREKVEQLAAKAPSREDAERKLSCLLGEHPEKAFDSRNVRRHLPFGKNRPKKY